MERHSYRGLQKLIHWLVAALAITTIPIGMIIVGYRQEMVKAVDGALGEGGFNMIYDLHKSIGVTILALMIVRVALRALWGAPPYARPLSTFERIGSRIVHGTLYVLLLVTPVVGWLGVSTYTAPVPWFWLFDVRLPVEKDRALSDFLLQDVHRWLGLLVLLLVLAHVAAAFKHLLVNRDGVFWRMIR
jgi:cytochrome b561